jgi:5-methylcytosine-specific restriction endonuclease McrBC GTP-binding regulatory subunit McrB
LSKKKQIHYLFEDELSDTFLEKAKEKKDESTSNTYVTYLHHLLHHTHLHLLQKKLKSLDDKLDKNYEV